MLTHKTSPSAPDVRAATQSERRGSLSFLHINRTPFTSCSRSCSCFVSSCRRSCRLSLLFYVVAHDHHLREPRATAAWEHIWVQRRMLALRLPLCCTPSARGDPRMSNY